MAGTGDIFRRTAEFHQDHGIKSRFFANRLRFVQKCAKNSNWEFVVNREQLIRALRKLARKQGIAFDVETAKGKGSHYRVKFADRITTAQHDLNPSRIARILKQLEINPLDL
jgi:hypothetical protein